MTFVEYMYIYSFGSCSLWELSKGLYIILRQGPLYCASVYHSLMKLFESETDIFSLWNNGTLVAPTSDNSNTFWQSLWVWANEVLL